MFEATLIYVLLINLSVFLVWGWDKRAAKRGARRVPEKRLLWMAALLGTPGAWLGTRVFRHKTIKKSFRVKLIAITVLQALLGAYLLYRKFLGE